MSSIESTRAVSAVLLTLTDTLGPEFDPAGLLYDLVLACVQLLDIDAAGVLLLDERGHPIRVACDEDNAAGHFDQMQAVTGLVIGAAQALVSRRRLPALRWTPRRRRRHGTSPDSWSVRLRSDDRTGLGNLAVQGTLTGVVLGPAQALALPGGTDRRRRWLWAARLRPSGPWAGRPLRSVASTSRASPRLRRLRAP